jgi:S-adenosylmethionine:tRNA ribosyltransferase-isomerase
MCVNRATGAISHHVFRDLPELLDASHTVVLNNSRVIRAQLPARRADGADCDLYLLREVTSTQWSCVGDQHSPHPAGEMLFFRDSTLQGTVVAEHDDGSIDVEFTFAGSVHSELERIGAVPLPPYIRDRSAEDQYQTVYARVDGSVAAPTAGLHFTPQVFEGLAQRGVRREEITLHVGYGTFAAVHVEDLAQHAMPTERFTLSRPVAERLNAAHGAGKRLLAVGTTVTRTLESCADERGVLQPRTGETSLFIHPPYRYRAIDALLTNFHMPGLTPIMLVAAFAGYELTMQAYEVALEQRYRFYSFGDSMLVL